MSLLLPRLLPSTACGRQCAWPRVSGSCGQRGHGPGIRRLASASYGPQPYGDDAPKGKRVRKPEWVRILEEDADNDPEVARLLEGTQGDPEKIREKMRYALKEGEVHREGLGSDVPPRVSFRAISPMGLWVWMEFIQPPLAAERELLEGVMKSWFAVGKLGGYNTQNLQVYQNADDDQSFFEYDNEDLGAGQSRMASYVHDIAEVEYQDNWARVWIDMGTADELALDVLINMLIGYSAQMCGLRTLTLGGENEDWPVPEDEQAGLMGADADYMKVGINPMKLPEGIEEELQFMDEEGMFEGAKGRKPPDADGSGGGYGITADPYGATAEERELQQIAARLRRPAKATAAAAARSQSGRAGSRADADAGYYGGGDPFAEEGMDLDFNPDELEFTDEGEDGTDGPAEAPASAETQPRRPWGASFVRRVKRDGSGRPPR